MSGQTPDPHRTPDGSTPQPSQPTQPAQPAQPAQPPAYGAPAYGQAPAAPPMANQYGQQPQPTGSKPGKVMGIVGLILAFFLPLIGMILSIIGLVQSKKAGFSNVPAVVGIIVGALLTILITIVLIASFSYIQEAMTAYTDACVDGGQSSFTVDGVEFACE